MFIFTGLPVNLQFGESFFRNCSQTKRYGEGRPHGVDRREDKRIFFGNLIRIAVVSACSWMTDWISRKVSKQHSRFAEDQCVHGQVSIFCLWTSVHYKQNRWSGVPNHFFHTSLSFKLHACISPQPGNAALGSVTAILRFQQERACFCTFCCKPLRMGFLAANVGPKAK